MYKSHTLVSFSSTYMDPSAGLSFDLSNTASVSPTVAARGSQLRAFFLPEEPSSSCMHVCMCVCMYV